MRFETIKILNALKRFGVRLLVDSIESEFKGIILFFQNSKTRKFGPYNRSGIKYTVFSPYMFFLQSLNVFQERRYLE